MKRLITAERVAAEFAAGQRRVAAPRGEVIITPAAWTRAFELGVIFDQAPTAKPTVPQPVAEQQGHCERVVDPSGVVLVRGDSVQLAPFPASGTKVGVADLITGRDGSPMTAGIMAWSHADSFPWTLDYDEVDLVLEGVLHLSIDGRTLEAKVGDVVSIPRGSKVHFGTPWRTKVYFVTYPADWAAKPQR